MTIESNAGKDPRYGYTRRSGHLRRRMYRPSSACAALQIDIRVTVKPTGDADPKSSQFVSRGRP
jgi:hypothetical protein